MEIDGPPDGGGSLSEIAKLTALVEALRGELLEERRQRLILHNQLMQLSQQKRPSDAAPLDKSSTINPCITNTPVLNRDKSLVKRSLALDSSFPAKKSKIPAADALISTQTAPISTQPAPISIQKKDSIPPIVLRIPGDFIAVRTVLSSQSIKFTSVQRSDSVKILCNTIEDFRKSINLLEERNYKFHTFTVPEEKPLRVVIRGLNASFSKEEIQAELESLKFDIVSVAQIINKRLNQPTLLFAITLKKSDSNKSIFNLDFLLNQRITVELQNKPKGISQCHKCQSFGHSAINCRADAACVKCAGNHISLECPHGKIVDSPLCFNCGGNHTANFANCPKNPNRNAKKNIQKKANPQTKENHSVNSAKPIHNTLTSSNPGSYAAIAARKTFTPVPAKNTSFTDNIQKIPSVHEIWQAVFQMQEQLRYQMNILSTYFASPVQNE
jgi:Associated with zinc fingers